MQTREQILAGDHTEIFLVKPTSSYGEHLMHNCNEVIQIISSKIDCKVMGDHWDSTSLASNTETSVVAASEGSALPVVPNNFLTKKLGIWISPISDDDFQDELERRNKTDAHIPEGPVAILDYGQSDSNKPTAKKEHVKELLRIFEQSGFGVILTSGKRSKEHIRGEHSKEDLNTGNNMQKWRRSKTDGLDLLQAMHLEIKDTGGLDDDSYQDTAEKIAQALSQYLEDEQLAEEAYSVVATIFTDNLSKAMDEVGHYLFKTFFEENVALARKKQPRKNLSFNQFIKKMQKNHAHPPSKSWCYNAVNLAADRKEFEMEGFADYEEIGLTHKVYLTRVNDKDLKKQLIQETLEHRYTVRQLHEKIQSRKRPRIRIDDKHLPSLDQINEFDLQKLVTYKNRVDKKIGKIENKLLLYGSKRDRYIQFLDNLSRCIAHKRTESNKKK